jgi:hypothetical protein
VTEVDTRLRRLRQQIAAIRGLHADDLQLILDELRGLAADLERHAQVPAVIPPTETAATPEVSATVPSAADPAAASPKRAKWLAEQEQKSHLTRRDLLRGREKDREKT